MVTFLFLFTLLSGTEKSVVNPYLTVDLQVTCIGLIVQFLRRSSSL